MFIKKIRICLKSFDILLINKFIFNIFNVAYKNNFVLCGPIPLPTCIKKFTILTSPHVDKDARDQFEIRTYKRLIDVINPNDKIIDILMRLDLIVGVNIKVILI